MTQKQQIPCIITVGEPGRAVVFGWADALPEPEQICELHDARMILLWDGDSGLFGFAAHGPMPGSRITTVVDIVRQTARQVLSVSPEAAEKISEWPDA